MAGCAGRTKRQWICPVLLCMLAALAACAQHGPGTRSSTSSLDFGVRSIHPGSGIENVFIANIPKHRVGAGVRRMALVGLGEMGSVNVRGMQKVFEGIGRVQTVVPDDGDVARIASVLRDGEISPAALNLLVSCCKADHLLLMVSSLAHHDESQQGEMAVFRVVAKVVDLSSGEILYETARSLGIGFPTRGKSVVPDAKEQDLPSGWLSILDMVVMSELAFELTYAFGGTHDGTIPYSAIEGLCMVASVLKGSPSDLAGIRANDIILKKGDTEIQGYSTCQNVRIAQGVTVPYRVLRDRTEIEIRLSFPAIPER